MTTATRIATRTATTTWSGTLESGTGTFGESSSGVLDGREVTWGSRTEAPAGRTSPEELAAAAHSACFSMALALRLGENQTPPGLLEVSADVTLAEADGLPTITTSELTVRAEVAGLDADGFDRVVEEAKALCPVSRLFAGAEIIVRAELVG
ncbi:MAG: OsmC family peroxiredoxin [Actinomycetales bacterium]|nr:OsmC family peroxiredoxin [Actinomycetales bacterium]